MPKIKRIDHVAIVVEDIEDALAFWQEALGLPLSQVKEITEQKSKVAFMPVGVGEVELVEPTDEDSGVARYLQKRGPGMHHLCFEVDDIRAVMTNLKARGVRLINESPMTTAEGKQFAFVHPQSANGVLVELYELPVH